MCKEGCRLSHGDALYCSPATNNCYHNHHRPQFGVGSGESASAPAFERESAAFVVGTSRDLVTSFARGESRGTAVARSLACSVASCQLPLSIQHWTSETFSLCCEGRVSSCVGSSVLCLTGFTCCDLSVMRWFVLFVVLSCCDNMLEHTSVYFPSMCEDDTSLYPDLYCAG